jgi:hypothetical protein
MKGFFEKKGGICYIVEESQNLYFPSFASEKRS